MSELLRRLIEAEKRRLDSEPESIADLIYRWNLVDFVEFAARPCPVDYCMGVSDLVYCSQKYYLRRRYPEAVLRDNLYAPWAGFGRLIHRGLQDMLKEYGFAAEREVFDDYEVDGYTVRVTGRLDLVGVWKGEQTVVEIKSSRSDIDLPKPPHVLQLRIYMLLARASRGILLYVTPDRITEYTVAEPLPRHELELLVRETIENTRHPRYSWECQYCPFSMMCPFKVSNNNRYYKR